jgi:hypothetical protein
MMFVHPHREEQGRRFGGNGNRKRGFDLVTLSAYVGGCDVRKVLDIVSYFVKNDINNYCLDSHRCSRQAIAIRSSDRFEQELRRLPSDFCFSGIDKISLNI